LNTANFKQKYFTGHVATHLRCGGIFDNHFTTNLLMNLPVKEIWKSVRIIGQSYRNEFGCHIFLGHSVISFCI